LKQNQTKNRNIVFRDFKQLTTKRLVHETLDEDKNLYVYKEEEDSINLFNDFTTSIQHNQKNDESKLISDFIYSSPYFADPRFVGEFLKRQNENGVMLFPLAGGLIKIRDDASHQRNLHFPSKLNKQSLQSNVSLLISIINEVGKKLGIDEEDMIEMKALNQLNDNFLLYLNWRKRQGFVLKMYDENGEENISYKEVSKKMIEFLSENKSQLEKVDENDNSQQAIDYILSILKVQVTSISQNDQTCSSIQLKTNNPFDLLIDEINWK